MWLKVFSFGTRREINEDTYALPKQPHEEISDALIDLFHILKAGRFEFAFRSAKEINVYLGYAVIFPLIRICGMPVVGKAIWTIRSTETATQASWQRWQNWDPVGKSSNVLPEW